jgi:hypothetical protein
MAPTKIITATNKAAITRIVGDTGKAPITIFAYSVCIYAAFLIGVSWA